MRCICLGGVYDPFRQGFDCKIPSGSLKVIYGAGETAQLSEVRLTTKSFVYVYTLEFGFKLGQSEIQPKTGFQRAGFLGSTRNMVFRWGSCKTFAKAVHFHVICGSAMQDTRLAWMFKTFIGDSDVLSHVTLGLARVLRI